MPYRSISEDQPGISGPVCCASLVAGPAFVMTMVLQSWWDRSIDAMSGDTWWPLALVVISPLVIGFGFILAVVPNLLGAWLLRWFATDNIGARLPIVWALAGGLFGGAIGLVLSAPQEIVLPLTTSGIACALLCRRGLHWS